MLTDDLLIWSKPTDIHEYIVCQAHCVVYDSGTILSRQADAVGFHSSRNPKPDSLTCLDGTVCDICLYRDVILWRGGQDTVFDSAV